MPLKTWKNCSQKLLIIGPNFFFSIVNRAKTSPNQIFCSIKMSPCATSIQWLWMALGNYNSSTSVTMGLFLSDSLIQEHFGFIDHNSMTPFRMWFISSCCKLHWWWCQANGFIIGHNCFITMDGLNPSVSTQSCIKRSFCSTLRFENLKSNLFWTK